MHSQPVLYCFILEKEISHISELYADSLWEHEGIGDFVEQVALSQTLKNEICFYWQRLQGLRKR